MKKYISPDFEVISFDIKSEVMTTTPTPTPTAIMMADSGSALTTISTNAYIPSDIEQKAWTSVDGGNWNWEDVE